jgi:hypothetical protein
MIKSEEEELMNRLAKFEIFHGMNKKIGNADLDALDAPFMKGAIT